MNYVFQTTLGEIKIFSKNESTAIKAVKRWDKKAILIRTETPTRSELTTSYPKFKSVVRYPYFIHTKKIPFND
jgi:hypothetical protein